MDINLVPKAIEGAKMLILTRKKDEEIIIDGNIMIKIVDVRGDKVRVGIAAPESVPVHRKEVYEKIQKETSATS